MSENIKVLKFGGSVLRGEKDLPLAVHEIYRHWRHGSKVLVVVSAFGGTTDELLNLSISFGDEPHPEALASLLLTGEATSAALLTMALDRVGIPAKPLSAAQAGLRTDGDSLDAEPVSVDDHRLRKELEHAVVVISGFGGVGADGGPTLLGRGGSDYTAVFLAERLRAGCTLIKDVAGLYEFDPAARFGSPRRFEHASYDTALRLGGPLVQGKSVRFAARHRLTIELAGLNSSASTRIGNCSDRYAPSVGALRPLRVSLLGCGTVGGGVFSRLSDLPDHFEVTGVSNLHREKALNAGIPEKLVAADPKDLIERDCDVVVELIGGTDAAGKLVSRALDLGRHVVSANKALFADEENSLRRAAHTRGAQVRFSAAVGGVVPALEAAERAGRTRDLRSVSGIVNGTCNYVCDQLATGIDFRSAVKKAQEQGFAEADPALDLNGTDAAQKLILLTRASFGIDLPLSAIDREGIERLDADRIIDAHRQGKAVRLIAESRKSKGGVEASVRPREVPLSHPFAGTKGAQNCIVFESEDGKKDILRGRGAGRHATTEAVIADLFDIRRSLEAEQNGSTPKAFSAEVCR
jgi:homoserine dehydrogenase